jgi:type II secretory ATPase GspE/PulE/Tfp pilus assembly ATPase PilB-like protein/DNA-binding response OmpR family regulator
MQIEAGKALVNAGLVSASAIESATLKSRTNNKPLLVNLFEGIDADTQRGITDTLAKFYNIPLLHLNRINPSPNLMRRCKPEQARQWYFLPIAEQGPHVVVGMIDPTDLNNVDMLQHIFHKPVQPVFIYAHDFENGLYRFFRKSDERPVENTQLLDTVQLQRALVQKSATAGGDNKSQAAIAARFARHIITRALTYGASSLLIEPKESELMISLNIEGGIYRLFRLSISHHERMMAALKQMVGLDSANGSSLRRSILLRFNGREYKLLMHFYPSFGGECATIRFIDPQVTGMSLEQLDLPSDIESAIKAALADSGLILVTGPTGSGKSSTTMAFLRYLVENGKHRIISMEDLVIERVQGVKQVQLSAHGPAKPAILKSVLDHHPDVVVIDEVTDEETMVLALQAASSGRCLLILCMEANNIAEAISHLLRMRLNRSQLASSLRFAYVQKVIRKICPTCKKSVSIHPDTRRQLHIPSTFTFYAGNGCDACKNTGYRGTATIGELLPFSSDLSEMLENGASGSEIYTEARHQGIYTLYERALNKAIDGATSLEEALGVFSLPQGFDFKNSLHLGRIGHLQKPDARQSNTQERLASVFEEEARRQSEPPDIDIFAAEGDEQAPASEIRHDSSPPEASAQDHGAEEVSEQESPVPESEALAPDKLMVLLLDDSPVMLEYTRHLLSSAGIFSVETASTAEEAWDKLQRQYFHLIITDHEMPGQTGKQLIERIRQQPTLNHTGTMLLTGNVKEVSALAGGADGYVGKPTDPELLVARAKSIAEIYKRMSMKAAQAGPETVIDESLPQPQGKDAGHVNFTEQDMNHIASFELDTQRFKLAGNTPESDQN